MNNLTGCNKSAGAVSSPAEMKSEVERSHWGRYNATIGREGSPEIILIGAQ